MALATIGGVLIIPDQMYGGDFLSFFCSTREYLGWLAPAMILVACFYDQVVNAVLLVVLVVVADQNHIEELIPAADSDDPVEERGSLIVVLNSVWGGVGGALATKSTCMSSVSVYNTIPFMPLAWQIL